MQRLFELFRGRKGTIRNASAAVIVGCFALACGSSDGTPSGAQSQIPTFTPTTGTVLASADVGNGTVVHFVDTPSSGIITATVGPVNAPRVDYSRLVGKSVTDIYRDLAGKEPPQALIDSEKKYATDHPIGSGVTDDKNLAPSHKATQQERGGLSALEDQLSDQATHFQNSYCNHVGVGAGTYSDAPSSYYNPTLVWDSGWCPLDVPGWAHSGGGTLQKAYNASASTSTTPGTLWVQKFVNGAWQDQVRWTLPNWYIVSYNFIGLGQYMSGMDGQGGPINFSERFRYAIPTIGPILPNFPDNVS